MGAMASRALWAKEFGGESPHIFAGKLGAKRGERMPLWAIAHWESIMMMTCCEARDFLAEYLTGAMSAIEREEFERHIAICDECTQRLRATKQAWHVALKSVARVPDPSADEVPDSLLRAILQLQARMTSNASRGLAIDNDNPRMIPAGLFSEVPIRFGTAG